MGFGIVADHAVLWEVVVDSKATADTRDREQGHGAEPTAVMSHCNVIKVEKKLPCYVVSHIYIHCLDV